MAVVAALSGLACSLLAQVHAAERSTVLRLSQRIIKAIQTKDVDYLSSIIDPKGINMGFDTDPMSADQFRKELKGRGATYCLLFDDSTCEKTAGTTIQHLIRDSEPVHFRVGGVQGEPRTLYVAVTGKDSSAGVLLSLFLRNAHGSWVLQSIEYQ